MYYTGIDIHCKHCYITVLDSEGNIFMSSEFDTSAKELIETIKSIPKPNKVAFEETGTADWVYRTISPYANEVIVCDPRQNSWIAKSRQKSDNEDSYKIAKLLQGNFIKSIYHTPDKQMAALKRLIMHYHDQVRLSTMLKNKIKAVYRQHGIYCQGKTVYDPVKRHEWLDKLKNPFNALPLKNLYAEMDFYEQIIRNIRKIIAHSSRKHPQIKLFTAIPGVGSITAVSFYAIIDTPFRFANKRRLWSYCGLGLENRESDGAKEPKRLNRWCNRLLKYVLLTAAKSAMACKGNRFTRQLHKLQLNGVPLSHARLTIARSICAIMYSIWKSGKEYEPQLDLKKVVL